MTASESSGSGGRHLRYHLPKRPLLPAEELAVLSAQVQRGVTELAAQFEPRLRTLIVSVGPASSTQLDLATPAMSGLRKAVLRQLATSEEDATAFQRAVIDEVRRAVRDDLAVGDPAKWVAEHLGDVAFQTHFPASQDDADILAQGKRELSLPLEEIVEANMRLAVAIARRYLGRSNGLALDDLRQEAALALRKAALHFDSARGFTFATFATSVIENHLCTVTKTAKDLSEHQAGQVEEFREAEAELAHELKRMPTEAEVLSLLSLSPEETKNVQSLLRALDARPLPAREESNETSVADRGGDPLSEADLRLSAHQLWAAIDRLPEDQRQVVILRNFQYMTFVQVAERLGLSSEDKARRRHKKALTTLGLELAGPAAECRTRERA